MIKSLFFSFSLFFITPIFACIPCNKDSFVVLSQQAKATFPEGYTAEMYSGEVTFSIDVVATDKIKNIKILNIIPVDLPKEIIIGMIKKSKFLLKGTSEEKAFLPCSVKGAEFRFEFLLPQKINVEANLALNSLGR